MSDAWRVELTRAAERDLRRLDQQVRRRVIAALDGLSAQPPRGDISHLIKPYETSSNVRLVGRIERLEEV